MLCKLCVNPKTGNPVKHRYSTRCPKRNMDSIIETIISSAKEFNIGYNVDGITWEEAQDLLYHVDTPKDVWFKIIQDLGTTNIDDPYFEVYENDIRMDNIVLDYIEKECWNCYMVSD